MLLRIKKDCALGRGCPLYRVYATTKNLYKVARAGVKHPKPYQKHWSPKSHFIRIK